MAKKNYLNDEQRIVLFKELRPALQAPPIAQDETIQEIVAAFDQATQQIDAWQQHEKQLSRMQEADALLDTCFLGLDAALATLQHKAFVTRDLTTWEQTQTIRNTLFPKGLSAIIHIMYKAEATEALAFLVRCEQPPTLAFLQQHQLTEWLTFIRDTRTEYLQAIAASKSDKAERAQLSQQTQAARKDFDQLLTRLTRYLRSKYPDGHTHATWREDSIEAALTRTQAAAIATQKANAQKANAQKSASPTNPTPSTNNPNTTASPTPSSSSDPQDNKC